MTIPARFTHKTVERMDAEIKKGHYASRSDLIKNAVENLLNEDYAEQRARKLVQDAIDNGAYDSMIEDRVRVAWGRFMATAAENSLKQS